MNSNTPPPSEIGLTKSERVNRKDLMHRRCTVKDSKINYPPEKLGGFFFVLNIEMKNGIISVIGCCLHMKTRGGLTVH